MSSHSATLCSFLPVRPSRHYAAQCSPNCAVYFFSLDLFSFLLSFVFNLTQLLPASRCVPMAEVDMDDKLSTRSAEPAGLLTERQKSPENRQTMETESSKHNDSSFYNNRCFQINQANCLQNLSLAKTFLEMCKCCANESFSGIHPQVVFGNSPKKKSRNHKKLGPNKN